MVAPIGARTAARQSPKADAPAAKPSPGQQAPTLGQALGQLLKSAFSEATLTKVAAALGGMSGASGAAHAEVAERHATGGAKSMGWEATETPKASESKVDPKRPMLFETAARIDAATEDWALDKAEMGGILYSIGQDLRHAKATGVSRGEFMSQVMGELGRLRMRTNMSPDLAPVIGEVGKQLTLMQVVGLGFSPESFEKLGLALQDGKPPAPVPVPGEAGADSGDAKLPPVTDTIIESYVSGGFHRGWALSEAEGEWLRSAAREMSKESKTVERLGPLGYAGVLAEKMAAYAAETVGDGLRPVSPGFKDRLANLAKDGKKTDLDLSKINVDPELAPRNFENPHQATTGGVGLDGLNAATGFNPMSIDGVDSDGPRPPGASTDAAVLQKERLLREQRARAAAEAQRKDNGGGGSDGQLDLYRQLDDQRRLDDLQRQRDDDVRRQRDDDRR